MGILRRAPPGGCGHPPENPPPALHFAKDITAVDTVDVRGRQALDRGRRGRGRRSRSPARGSGSRSEAAGGCMKPPRRPEGPPNKPKAPRHAACLAPHTFVRPNNRPTNLKSRHVNRRRVAKRGVRGGARSGILHVRPSERGAKLAPRHRSAHPRKGPPWLPQPFQR
jgi:hypothetical protein